MSGTAMRCFNRMSPRRRRTLDRQDAEFFSDPGQKPLTPAEVFELAADGQFLPWRHWRDHSNTYRVQGAVPIGCDSFRALESGELAYELVWANNDHQWYDSYDVDSGYYWDCRDGYEDSYWDHHDFIPRSAWMALGFHELDEFDAYRAQVDALWAQHDAEIAEADLAAERTLVNLGLL